MREIMRRLSAWRQASAIWALALVAAVSLVGASAEFVILVHRESQLVDRFSDSTWWIAAQFRSEIQQMHVSLATFDGSPDALDDVRAHYDILTGRLGLMDVATMEPPPDAGLTDAINAVRTAVIALGPQVGALTVGGKVPRQLLTVDLRVMGRAAGRMTSMSAQADAAHRGAARAAIQRANIAFALALVLLIGSLLLSLRAVDRQAAGLDASRRRSEALSADLSAALALAQAGSRAKNVFLATMSHEIRTPMNGLLGAAALLIHTTLNGQQRRWVEIIRACGEALLAQLDDVLDFSALDAASTRLERDVFDIRALAEDVARVVESAAGANGLDLIVVIDPDVPDQLLSDKRRIAQVLLNLLTNAVKFTAEGGVVLRVSLRHRSNGAWLRAAIIDSGPGIAREDRRRIFREFTRLDQPSERTVRGTGLGLAISLRIADALGGHIHVAAASGGGSVFWMTIPVEVPPDAVAPPAPAPAGRAVVRGGAPCVRRAMQRLLGGLGYGVAPDEFGAADLLLLHAQTAAPQACAMRVVAFGPRTLLDAPITAARLTSVLDGRAPMIRPVAAAPLSATRALRLLVADDDAINREIAASLLHHLGHQVTVAEDGRHALAAVRAAPFDAALVDLHMPRMDGAAFARAVRALPPPTGTMRLIAVTADADADTRVAVVAAGVDQVLIKPVTLERLADALRPLAERPAAAGAAAIDAQIRDTLLARLPAGRFPGLIRTFWDGLLKTLESPAGLAEGGLERRLHTLSGSAGSLGYCVVTPAARRARELVRRDAAHDDALDALYHALDLALRADQELLPPQFVALVAARIADVRLKLVRADEADRRGVPVGGLT